LDYVKRRGGNSSVEKEKKKGGGTWRDKSAKIRGGFG